MIDRIISEDWTKKNKNNLVCFGALIIITGTGKCNIETLPTNHIEYRVLIAKNEEVIYFMVQFFSKCVKVVKMKTALRGTKGAA